MIPQNEKVIEVKFLDNNWFYAVGEQGPGLFAIRFSNVKSLLTATATGVKAPKFAFEIRILNMNRIVKGRTQGYFEATVQDSKLNVLARESCKCFHFARPSKTDLPYIIRSPNGVIFMIDTVNSNYIAWKGDSLVISTYNLKVPKSIQQIKTSVFFKGEQGEQGEQGADCEFVFEEFPKIKVNKVTIPSETQSVLKELSQINSIHCKVLNRMAQPEHSVTDCNYIYCQYSLVERCDYPAVEENMIPDQQSDKGELKESIFEKINKIKKEHKKRKSDDDDTMEVQKDMLKELRADISSKIKEMIQFKKQYNREQMRWKPEEMIEPEGVPKEELKLYEKIKTEKKKFVKEREKKKDQKKEQPIGSDFYLREKATCMKFYCGFRLIYRV